MFPAAQVPVLVASDGSKFQVWDLSADEPRLRCSMSNRPFASDNIQTLAVTPDGQRVMTAHLNRAVRFWDVSGSKAFEEQPVQPNPVTTASGLGMAHHGPFVFGDLLLSTTDAAEAAVWRVADGKLTTVPPPSLANKPVVATLGMFGSHDRYFVGRGTDANKGDLTVFRHRDRFEPMQRIDCKHGDSATLNDAATRMAVGQSGNLLEVYGRDDAESPFQKLSEVNTSYGRHEQVAFLNDQTLVSRSDSRLVLWDIQPTAIKMRAELSEHDVHQFDISPDRNTLATDSYDGVNLWNLKTSPPQLISKIGPSLPEVATSIAFSPDGRHLAVGFSSIESADCGIDVIDLTTGLATKRLTFPGLVRHITYTPDARHLVAATAHNTIYVVRLP